VPEYTYRCELVTCGKANCVCCPHGPYWYAYWRDGKRMRKKYIGKQLTPKTALPPLTPAQPMKPEPMDIYAAKRLLGLRGNESYATSFLAWQQARKKEVKRGDWGRWDLVAVDQAWSIICVDRGW
jgi:hypothetical protein